jgi:hypothetical protein
VLQFKSMLDAGDGVAVGVEDGDRFVLSGALIVTPHFTDAPSATPADGDDMGYSSARR